MQHIYEKLNITIDDGLHIFNKDMDVKNFPQRLNRSLKIINPTSIFIFNNKPIILFFDKDIDKKEVFKQCWNFSEAPIIIINNDDNCTFEIYNGFEYIKNVESLGKINDDNELTYISLVSGKYFENSGKLFDQKNKVDKKLLKNIKDARELLISFNLQENKNIANSLIGRIIFIRYLIDREVKLKFNSAKAKKLTNDELKEILNSKEETYKLFNYLKSKDNFNGDWFPIDTDELNLVDEKHLQILNNLISGTDIGSRQGSLFDIYDFSIIPIEFISNVYESFIGEESQSKNGAYYTPTFLVDYILKYTVDDYFKNNPKEYNCKVLDPACGSGIFLVETLRKLVNQYEIVKKRNIKPQEIIELVKDNIYGIDKDENAVQISIFSLYLTMLDYQTPKDIEKFHFPYLLIRDDNPNPNFFQDDFFNIDAKYNSILKEKKINFIVGNPPYGRSLAKDNIFINQYIVNNKMNIGGQDIIQPFMIRVKDISSKNTKVSFIIASKLLYNRGSKNFRTDSFFNTFKVEHILELSSIRTEIFDNADVPVSIIFYKYSNEEEVRKNTIKYISIKPNPLFSKLKILFIGKNDFKKVLQSKLIDNDYLWKILVYGSYLDFNFIKKLKSDNYNTIQDMVDNEQLIKYQGFKRKDGSRKIDTTRLKDFDFIDTGSKKKDLKPFYISNDLEKFNYDTVGYTNRKVTHDYTDIYKPPTLLFTGGLNIELKQNSAMCYKNAVFTSSVVALKSQNNNTDILKTINGLFYSKYFSYYLLHIASSTGIRQEECDDYEKLSLPYIENKGIVKIVNSIEKLKNEYYKTNINLFENNTKKDYDIVTNYESNLNKLLKKLDNIVIKSLNITEEENSIIDYSIDIIIPWTIQNNYEKVFKQLDYKNKIDKTILEEYINIFIKHYSNIYEQNNMYFNAEVLWDKYTICIYFKVLKTKPTQNIIWEKDKDIRKFLDLAGNKTMENLYIQKDIKGFESDGFYILKPNEYKNWHKAIGYLDFYEIDDAILRAGK